MTVTQINLCVQQRFGHPRPGYVATATRHDENQQTFVLITAMAAIGVFVAMVAYGTLVVQIARVLIAGVGFAAIFLAIRISGSSAFQPTDWISRSVAIAVVCVLSWVSLNYAEQGIETTIVEAQRQRRAINSLPDMISLFGFAGVLKLGHLALALLITAVVSVMAFVSQGHMLLSAYAATASDHDDWRVQVLATIGNRSGIGAYAAMLMLSLLGYAAASGLWQRAFSIN